MGDRAPSDAAASRARARFARLDMDRRGRSREAGPSMKVRDARADGGGDDGDGDDAAAPSSRLCVKNVPKHLKDGRLREHFAVMGEVTDVKIVRTADGTSRQMAFVGFKTEEMASEALKYFNGTFIDTSRVEVQYARSVHSAQIPRPWSKYSAGSSANKEKERKKAPPEEDGEGERWIGAREAKKLAKQRVRELHDPRYKAEQLMKVDPKFREFMELMVPQKQRFWSDGFFENQDTLEQYKDTEKVLRDEGEAGSSDDEYQDIADSEEEEEEEEEEEDEDSESESDSESDSGSGSDKVAMDEKVSDMDYFKSKQSSWKDDASNDGSESDDESGSDSSDSDDSDDDEDDDSEEDKSSDSDKDQEKEEAGGAEEPESKDVNAADMEALSETGRIFVRNLPYTATEEEVAALFEKFGKLTAVHILVDRGTKRSKGLAYVTFALPEDGMKAMEAIDGSIFQGRLIHLLPAKRAPQLDSTMGGVGRTGEGEEEKKDSFKTEREAERKADAGNTKAWNSLFMRQDTVAAAIAAHYGVTKAELLESDADDLAVRMALGEAHVISTTKQQLTDAGVDAESLERSAASSGAKSASRIKRSKCILLLKNLPYEAEEDELRELCEKFGGLAHFILPDTHTIAVVEFLEAAEARRAFTGLAYKRYRHVPLYVEWAPEDIFDSSSQKIDIKGAKALAVADAASDLAKEAREKTKAKVDAASDLAGKTADEDATSIFVKGLDFGTVEKKLRAHFVAAAERVSGRVLSARVVTHRGPGGKLLSRGFGFVEFDQHIVAKSVLNALQGSSLDGKTLKLELSSQGGARDDDVSNKVPRGFSATKLVVRNVAFEATKRDIQKLFNPFGQLKQVRLPKKFDGAHRGFAFIEFNTRSETQAAMDALKGTHLYGRHIIIERAADEEEDVEAIRKKTTSKFEAAERASKRSRIGS